MSAQTDEKSLAFMEAAGPALEAARKLAAAVDQEKTAAAIKADPLADAMIADRLVETHERPQLLDKLSSHDGAIEVLGNLVSHIAELKTAYAQKLAVAQGGGAPVSDNGHDKAAAQREAGRPFAVGQRAGLGEKRASDEPLRRLANLPE